MADLRFGTFLAPSLMPMYQAVTDAVGRQLGKSTELVVETSYDSCLEDVNDVCFVCSLPYVMYERRGLSPAVPIAAPVLLGARYLGAPIYYSDVIVHRNSQLRSFLDLRGRTWAWYALRGTCTVHYDTQNKGRSGADAMATRGSLSPAACLRNATRSTTYNAEMA